MSRARRATPEPETWTRTSWTCPQRVSSLLNCADEPFLCQGMLASRVASGVRTPVIKYYHFLEVLDRAGGCSHRFVVARGSSGQPGGGQKGGSPGPPDPDSAEHWETVPHREAVVLLNDASFDQILRRSQDVLVFFYAPWCIHCSNLKQTYASAAYELADEGFQGCMAAIDISSNPLLERIMRIEFLPAFKLFHQGEFRSDHSKLRTKEDFTQLMKRVSKKMH